MPETKQGTCPWCGTHDKTLFFTTGVNEGRLWCDWICAHCLQAASEIADLKAEKAEGI